MRCRSWHRCSLLENTLGQRLHLFLCTTWILSLMENHKKTRQAKEREASLSEMIMMISCLSLMHESESRKETDTVSHLMSFCPCSSSSALKNPKKEDHLCLIIKWWLSWLFSVLFFLVLNLIPWWIFRDRTSNVVVLTEDLSVGSSYTFPDFGWIPSELCFLSASLIIICLLFPPSPSITQLPHLHQSLVDTHCAIDWKMNAENENPRERSLMQISLHQETVRPGSLSSQNTHPSGTSFLLFHRILLWSPKKQLENLYRFFFHSFRKTFLVSKRLLPPLNVFSFHYSNQQRIAI